MLTTQSILLITLLNTKPIQNKFDSFYRLSYVRNIGYHGYYMMWSLAVGTEIWDNNA